MYQPFFGSYLPASKWGRERLTVCPRNPRLEVRFSGLYFTKFRQTHDLAYLLHLGSVAGKVAESGSPTTFDSSPFLDT